MLVEVCQSLHIPAFKVFVIIFSSTAGGVYKLLTMLLVKLPGPVVPVCTDIEMYIVLIRMTNGWMIAT